MKTKRPIPIILLLILVCLLLVSTLIGFLNALSHGKFSDLTSVDLILKFSRPILVSSFLAFIFWAIYTRKIIGRWISLFILALMFIGTAFMAQSSSPLIKPLQYQNPELDNLVQLIITFAIYSSWAYLACFSKASALYFCEKLSLHHSSGTR